MSLNSITLMGRLTRDVELRYTKTEKPVASFSVAVDRDGRDAGTDFFDIVAWNKTAEFVNNYWHKGDPIILTGRLQNREWTDRSGNKRVSAEIVADKLVFVPRNAGAQQSDPGSYSSSNNGSGGYGSYQGVSVSAADYSDLTDADGELPF